MNENYVQGFMDKCAQAGVDPEALLKQSVAWGALLNKGINKGKGMLRRYSGNLTGSRAKGVADRAGVDVQRGRDGLTWLLGGKSRGQDAVRSALEAQRRTRLGTGMAGAAGVGGLGIAASRGSRS